MLRQHGGGSASLVVSGRAEGVAHGGWASDLITIATDGGGAHVTADQQRGTKLHRRLDQGKIDFHEWIGDSWAILFSHPKDFTPVCTTELGYMAGLKPEFDKRNCKIIGLSVDPVDDHKRWSKDIQDAAGHSVTYPLIGDPELKIAMAYDMLPEGA